MDRRTEREKRSELASEDERRFESLENVGLLHLVACLGTAIAVVIAVNVFD